jgi:hypothetical protein
LRKPDPILTTHPTAEVQEEFNEQVQSVYRRSKGRAEAERELIAQGDALLAQIDALAESAAEFQVYIGLAFHRRLSFEKKALLDRLIASGPCPTTVLESLRTGKMVRVAASAKPAWDGLWDRQPHVMWHAIILNSRQQFQTAKAEAAAAEATESDDQDDTDEDIDHDND